MKTPKRTFFSSINELSGAPSSLKQELLHVCDNFAVGYRIKPTKITSAFLDPDTPYRADDYRFILFHKAENLKVQGNLQTYEVRDESIGFMGPGGIIQIDDKLPPDLLISPMLIKQDYMRQILGEHHISMMNGSVRNFAIVASSEQFAISDRIISTLHALIATPDFNDRVAQSLLAAFVHLFIGIYEANGTTQAAPKTREEAVLADFLALVNEHCAQHHTLDFYADRLCLSERYMGTLVRQASGTTAKEWIDRAIIAQAKVALRYSDVSIGELAYQLNFPNVAFFCKYFKRLTGLTPTQYRTP